jgi:hypothetical protein
MLIGAVLREALCYNGNENDETHPAQKQSTEKQDSKIEQSEMDNVN